MTVEGSRSRNKDHISSVIMFLIKFHVLYDYFRFDEGTARVFSKFVGITSQTPIAVARCSLSGKHQHERLGVVML